MENFNKIRRELDDAITYADFDRARELAGQGYEAARYQENLGEMMYFQAQFAIIEEDFQEAKNFFDLAVKFNPNDGASFNDRALCVIELGGDSAQALADFDHGIKVEPDYASVYHNKGWYLNKLGRHQEAIVYFEKTLLLEPNRAVTYENLADAYLNLQKVDQAVAAYYQAIACLKPAYAHIKEQIEEKIRMVN
jgi:tetratricopeptide (TPR) repeat protein